MKPTEANDSIPAQQSQTFGTERLYYEKWEVELQACFDSASFFLKSNNQGKEEESILTMGLLFIKGHLKPETYEFINKWIQLLIISKTSSLLEEAIDKFSGYTERAIWQLLEDSPSLIIS